MKHSLEERFWSKVDIAGTDECWLWIASVTCEGYGRILGTDGRVHSAARIAYQLAIGSAGALQVDHICHNRRCCNPHHLRLVTNKQNGENRSGAHRNSKTGIRGVSKHRNRWRARVFHHGKPIEVGSFASIEEASTAVRAKRLELFTHNEIDKKEHPR